MKKSIICFLLIHKIPPVEGSISGMSLGAPASRRHRAKRERVPSGDREPRKVAGRRLPGERSLCHPGMIFADKQVHESLPAEYRASLGFLPGRHGDAGRRCSSGLHGSPCALCTILALRAVHFFPPVDESHG